MKKRLLPMVLVCCLLSALLAVAAQADDIVAKGDCGATGSNVKWTLDSAGRLTLTGAGAIRDYQRYFYWESDNWWGTCSDAPWYAREEDSPNNRNLITSLIINEGITCIGSNAFLGLQNLTKITLPDSLTQIKDGAFQRCSSLTKITLPDNVASIEANAFRYAGLLSFTMPDKTVNIGDYAFNDCNHLVNIVIPESVEYLGRDAFRDCDRLQSVVILGEISAIKARTFQDCPALTEITIPDSVMLIGADSFSNCNALKDIHFTGTESLWKEISVDDGNEPFENVSMHFDTSPEAAYRINALSVFDTDGNPLTAIPESSFLATVSVTNRASGATPIVFLASYDAKGQYQGLAYVTVKEPVGGTVEITLPVDNSGGNVAQLKAFAVKSFSGMEVIGNPVSFPAQ